MKKQISQDLHQFFGIQTTPAAAFPKKDGNGIFPPGLQGCHSNRSSVRMKECVPFIGVSQAFGIHGLAEELGFKPRPDQRLGVAEMWWKQQQTSAVAGRPRRCHAGPASGLWLWDWKGFGAPPYGTLKFNAGVYLSAGCYFRRPGPWIPAFAGMTIFDSS